MIRRHHTTRALAGVAALATLLLFAGLAGSAAAQARDARAPIGLAELEQMALERHPALDEAEAAIDAARGRARQAGTLPNPTIGYTADEVSGGPIIRGGEHGLFMEQTIPLGGKLRLSREVFEREADRTEALGDARRAGLLTGVRVAFYAALAAERRVAVRERLARLGSEATEVSAQLYNVGAADHPDVLAVEIEARLLHVELTTARNARERAWLVLASAVGHPSMAPRPLAGALEGGLPELARDEALAMVLAESPELAAARAGVARAEAALARERREPVPDLVLRGGPRYNRELLEEGPAGRRPVGWEGAWDIGLTIPLFNRNRGAIAAAQADLRQAAHEVERVELAIRTRFAHAFDQYLSALHMAEIYQDELLPRAEQAYELYLARYREMGAAYPQVLVAQRELFEISDRYVSALERVWRFALEIRGFLTQ